MELIFVGIVGVSSLLFVLLLYSIFGKQPGEEVRARMEQYLIESEVAAKAYVPPDEEEAEEKPSEDDLNLDQSEEAWVKESKGSGSGAKKLLFNIGSIITPRGMAARIASNLAKAEVPLKANEFVAIQFLSTMGPIIFGFLILKNIIYGLIMGLIGFIAPQIWLSMRKGARLLAFKNQILDTLITMSNGMKAGYSLLQAMEMVAREGSPPMSTELKRVIKENSLGMNLEDALKALNDRVESEDWDLVTTVVLIQRQVGGNLSEILDKIGFTLRQRMKLKGDIATKTAQAKASGAMVGALPFGIGFMIYLINPKFISMLWTFKMGFFRGWFVIVFGLIWEVIGMFIIMKIVDIEV
ncbi:MAG: type II secretion system F family protein [Candidatus Riflebacteria bacterium]|nr:type II secretion system F family protein [Candidatus Riflebacteria bacterium]